MSLRRGALYCWASFTHFNIWRASDDGHGDIMPASGWATQWAEKVGAENLYGVAIPLKDWDELVVRAYDGMTERQRRRARTREDARKRLTDRVRRREAGKE